jgi:hypothetical protein
MSLYKYLPPERIDVLESGSIAVSLPTERNDPFDELPAVDLDMSDQELECQYAKHHIRIPLEEYKETLRLQESQRSAEMAVRLRSAQAETFGAICLSRVWDSIPMWSYYAHEHRGFVVEFDETHNAFLDRFADGVVPIVYGNRGLVRGKLNRQEPLPQTIKAPAWSHEQEMRIFYKLDQCDPPIIIEERKIILARFPREAVTRVLLGCRVDQRCKAMIQQNLRRWGFSETTLVALSPHYEHFSFLTEELYVSEAGACRGKTP